MDSNRRELARQARELLDRLKEVRAREGRVVPGHENMKKREKQAAIRARAGIKDDAINLLDRCALPHPISYLFQELLKDERQKRLPGSIDINRLQIYAAGIEAEHMPDPENRRPSVLNVKQVSDALTKAHGDDPPRDYRRRVRSWTDDRQYWEMVYSQRPDADSMDGARAFDKRNR